MYPRGPPLTVFIIYIIHNFVCANNYFAFAYI